MAKNTLLKPLIVLLAHTGLGRAEALNLKWTDVDLKDKLIYVRQSKTGQSRIVPLELEAQQAIEELKSRSPGGHPNSPICGHFKIPHLAA